MKKPWAVDEPHDEPRGYEIGTTRGDILEILRQRRGAHKSELCRLINRGWGTVGHHVYVMVQDGYVETEVHGRLLWVFLPGIPEAERDWIVATRVPERLRLLELLGLKRVASIESLSNELALSKKAIRTHLGHLRSAGAVKKVQNSPALYEPAPIPAIARRRGPQKPV